MIGYGRKDTYSQSSYHKSPPQIERVIKPEQIESNVSSPHSHQVHMNRNIQFQADDALELTENEEWDEMKRKNLKLQDKLKVALKNVED